MRRTLLLATVVCAAAVAAPASASTSSVSDACGDAGRVHESHGLTVNWADGRVDGFDIERVLVRDRDDSVRDAGVEVVLDLCGDVPAAELPGSVWDVSWQLDDRCSGGVRVGDVRRDAAVVRTAHLTKACASDGRLPVTGQPYTTASVVYDLELPASAWTVDGDTVTVSLDPGLVGEGAEQVRTGSVLAQVTGGARDGRWVTEADLGRTELGPLVFQGTRQTGPGARDWTGPGATHTVA